MLTYIQAGGYSMIVVIVFSIIMLVTAVRFFFTATPERLAFLRAMTLAHVFCVVGGVAQGFTAVFWHVVPDDPSKPIPYHLMLIGFGEALTTAGLGLSLLAVVWLLVAFGVRRAHDVVG